MSFDRVSQKREDIAALLAAGFDHRQHGLDETTPAGALCPKGELPPDHRVSPNTANVKSVRFDAGSVNVLSVPVVPSLERIR